MKRSEQELQIQLVAALRRLLPKPWLVVHVPNGGGRSKAEAGIFKAMGVLAGFPDLLVIGPRIGWLESQPSVRSVATLPNVIALELKAPPKMLKSGKPSKAKANLSDAQREVIATLGQCGIPTLVVHSLPEAIDALKALGVPLRGRSL